MKPLALLVLLSICLVFACTNRVGVGRNKSLCRSDSDCLEMAPRCETEVGVCAQCLDASDCTGSDPWCDAGRCACADDSECLDGLFCIDDRCRIEQ